ncbi:MAG: hypothetical protein ABI193_05330 [Minicystis sp.]
MRARLLLVAALPTLLALFFAVGCGTDYYNISDFGRNCTPTEVRAWGCDRCPHACALLDAGADGADGADGAGEIDGGADAGEDGGMACEGECVPSPYLDWQRPVLLARGPEGTVPACPEQAQSAQEWHADLIVPPASCDTCTCDPPVGACYLPTEMMASTATCAGPSSEAWTNSFNAPAGWGGACTSMDALPAGCNGPLCVKSVTIAPLSVTAGDCSPVTTGAMSPPAKPSWGTFARTCNGTPHSGVGGCPSSDQQYAPDLPAGFLRCAYRHGDLACAAGTPYTERHVLYESYADTRGCSLCTCGDAVGDACHAKVSVFSDSACSTLLETHSIDLTGPSCFDLLPAGSALGSKSATSPTYVPGVCAPSGGAPTGAVEPLFPMTFCCIPA